MVSGTKRYVIQPPDECEHLELLPYSHPSGRHASWNWASPEEREKRADKPFCKARTTEVMLNAGEVLYLPSFWFHYIVSLDRSMQCNSRDGQDHEGSKVVSQCMMKLGR